LVVHQAQEDLKEVIPLQRTMQWPKQTYDLTDPTAVRRLLVDAVQELCRRYRRDGSTFLQDSAVLHCEFYHLMNQVPGVEEARIICPEWPRLTRRPASFAIGMPGGNEPLIVLELAFEPSDGGIMDRRELLRRLPAAERWLVVIAEDSSYLLDALQPLSQQQPPFTICYCDRGTKPVWLPTQEKEQPTSAGTSKSR
jgi:hypothetical protein